MAMLEVTSLGISFGGLRAVDELSMKIEKGGLVGLIGPNLSLIHIYFVISHYERYTVGNGKAKCGNAARKGAMRCDLGVPNLTIWYTLSRRGAQCAPEQRKIERFVGEQCPPLRLRVCMRVACGDHQSSKKQPPAKSRLPQEDAARKEDENGHARNPVQQACKPPVREVPERHAAVERGHGPVSYTHLDVYKRQP